jgi:large subunit ribosomal protein L34e
MEKPKIAKCAVCKKPLHGISRLNVSQIRKLSKSNRRPSRAYGGTLCSSCAREVFKDKARII